MVTATIRAVFLSGEIIKIPTQAVSLETQIIPPLAAGFSEVIFIKRLIKKVQKETDFKEIQPQRLEALQQTPSVRIIAGIFSATKRRLVLPAFLATTQIQTPLGDQILSETTIREIMKELK